MEKKKFSIELPKGGMSDLTKQVRNSPITEPPADARTSSKTSQNMANVSGCLRMSNERLSASNLNLMQNSISGS